MSISIFVDTANPRTARDMLRAGDVKGVTSNPAIARLDGVATYPTLVAGLAPLARNADVSVAVPLVKAGAIFADATAISRLEPRIYVKIPPHDRNGASLETEVSALAESGVRLNITAVTDVEQLRSPGFAGLHALPKFYVSIFAGRISDAGDDPRVLVSELLELGYAGMHVLWASTRNLFAITLAEESGCSAITLPPSMLENRRNGRSRLEMSTSAIAQFNQESIAMRYHLDDE